MVPSCTNIPIADSEFCADMGDIGATCVHMLSIGTRDIPKAQWDLERVGQICENSQAVADFKSELEKLCHVSGKCTYNQKKMMSNFFDRIKKIGK